MDEQEKSNEIVQVKDVSGEVQRQREEALKQKIEVRKKALVDLVIRQTDYDEDKAMIKLIEWNYNYLNVIKEYMNPNFQNVKKEEKTGTKNQMIYGEIRSFMDDVNKQALWRKRQKEKMEKKREAYIEYLKKQQEAKQKQDEDK
mgnify:FL=1|tara:strand:- start:3311 stop:3742 length:432 start_codon:yes stop_codon:yes gene_type:complete